MRRKGFTLIELMIVILIISILAAVVAPMLSGRINDAKWAEGRAGAGTIVTALRAYMAEEGGIGTAVTFPLSGGGTAFDFLGITEGDLNGKYFLATCYEITSASYEADTGACGYVITVTVPTGSKISPASRTLTTTSGGTVGVWDVPAAPAPVTP